MDILRWDQIRAELDGKSWEKLDEGRLHRTVFVGVVAQLAPSGKQYLPFETDLVSCVTCQKNQKKGRHGPCSAKRPCVPLLDGPHLHCDYCRDEFFQKDLIKQALQHNFYVTTGEDWTDVCVGEIKNA